MKRTNQPVFLVFATATMFLASGCASNPSSLPPEPVGTNAPLPAESIGSTAGPETSPAGPSTLAEIETSAGFDVQEPAYLPEGVYFNSATYQDAPHPSVTSQFNLVHEQYGDVGQFFLITQQPQEGALSNPCGNDCETLQVGDTPVNYHLNKSADNPGADTETLTWESAGFSFQLLRTAGEPNKTYKDELLKVVGSMK